MQLFSNKTPLASETPTMLACMESFAAAIVVLFVLIPGESYWIWALYSAAGWTLLLRTNESTKLGLKWFKRTCVYVGPFFEGLARSADDDNFANRGMRGVAKLMLLVVLTLIAVLLKTAATVLSFVRSPLTSFQSISTNWKRSMFCVDSACPFEIIPGVMDQLGVIERLLQNQHQPGTEQQRPFLVDFLDTSHVNILKNTTRRTLIAFMLEMGVTTFFMTFLVGFFVFLSSSSISGSLFLIGFVECLFILTGVWMTFIFFLFVFYTSNSPRKQKLSLLYCVVMAGALYFVLHPVLLHSWSAGHYVGIIGVCLLTSLIGLACVTFGLEHSFTKYPGRLLFFIPAIMYRISLKLTIILYLPLLFSTSKTSDVRKWIKDTHEDKWRTLAILASFATIILFLGKSLLLGVGQKLGASQVIVNYLSVDRLPLWQLAGLVASVLTIVCYIWSDIHVAMHLRVTRIHEFVWNVIQSLRSFFVNYIMIGHIRFAMLLLDLPFAVPSVDWTRFFPEP